MSEYHIVGDQENGFSEALRCERCQGRGYHHGFGEHGWDPDWCTRCGGSGFDWRELLTVLET